MSYQIELRHLRYFLAVSEELHYRKAAEKLFISQPGLSRQIKQMEDDLEITLFNRHNRKVELTKAGEYLKEELKRSLKNFDNILNHAKLIHDGLEGHLNFGYVGSAMQEIIPNALLKFRKENPKALFSLKEMDNQKQISSLLHGDIDVGFVRLDRVPKEIQIKRILKENFCLVLPQNHHINITNFKNLNQLKDDDFILFNATYSSSYYEKVMHIFSEAEFTPNVTHNTIHAGSIYKLVELGFGISIVPKSLKKETVGIRFLELNKIKQKTTLSLVWKKSNRNPILKEFLKHI